MKHKIWATGKILIITCIAFFTIASTSQTGATNFEEDPYVCTPCGSDCDKGKFDKPGECAHCNMKLVKASTIHFKNISPAELCNVMSKDPKTILLDVRTPAEFNGTADVNFGRLKGAINIPIQELEQRMEELKAYKNKNIIVYCSHSHRSPRASYMLNQNGFKQVSNMSGGMSVWNDEVKNENCTKNLLVK